MIIKATYPSIEQNEVLELARAGLLEGLRVSFPVEEMAVDLIQAACDWKRYEIAVDNNIRRDSDGATATERRDEALRQVRTIAAMIVAKVLT